MMYQVALLKEAKRHLYFFLGVISAKERKNTKGTVKTLKQQTHYSSDIAQLLMFINLNTLCIIGQNACLDY